jgi:hypothetical protein
MAKIAGGRPRLKVDEKLSERVLVNLRRSERRLVERQARGRKIATAAYLRELVLAGMK